MDSYDAQAFLTVILQFPLFFFFFFKKKKKHRSHKATSKRRIASSSSECDGALPKKTAAHNAAKKISLFFGLGRSWKFAS